MQMVTTSQTIVDGLIYKIQNRNSRHNTLFTIDGETRCLSEWCEILNLNYKNVLARVTRYNWSIGEALELIERK